MRAVRVIIKVFYGTEFVLLDLHDPKGPDDYTHTDGASARCVEVSSESVESPNV